ncbi:response regulator, partial [bacterium]|nr:response regulator [bacterium]
GISSFYPEQIQDNPIIPNIILTSFKKFNEEVQLDTAISYKSQITLSPNENVFSFEFTALNFINAEENKFAYKMDGFNKDWITTDASNRIASYTNLDPGDYTFRVKGSNNDGVWNETGTSIKITILPPWWRTVWAYGVYILALGFAFYRYRNFELNRAKLNQKYEMEHFEATKLKEMDQVKSRFFANISHEFRTPLTLILGPLGKMLGKLKGSEWDQDLNLMQRQAKQLLDLVTQLLDLSKLEAGKMKILVSQRNIVPLLKGLTQSFASLADRDNKTLSFITELEDIQVHVDRDAMTKIINNLLSNAFKFTESGAAIQVDVQNLQPAKPDGNGHLSITIRDDGIGIPEERLNQIFDRFYQVDNSETREREGTGIGLALTRELVELHHGSIEVSSAESTGTTFTITLPLGADHLKPEEVSDSAEDLADEALEDQLVDETDVTSSSQTVVDESQPILLIVEDNPDVRNYIKSDLNDHYNCHEAVDGEAGLEQALDLIPDLIISDVMMPKMDGVEFCRRIKTEERTSHIPVILLTAKADLESKLEGLETGADDYLTKPFEVEELQVRIKNLIEQRELLRERFKQDLSLVPADLNLPSMDEQFLEKAIGIISDHFSDQKFNVDVFSRKIFMSRQHLHRKLKSITGRTAVEFIRFIRLKSAALLLRKEQGTISEIAYEVGFSSLPHFSRAFHDEFGCSPSAYLAKHKAGD